MLVLTFFGSSIMDYVQIGPLRLRVKSFVDRPLQCYGCFDFGHGRKNCTKPPRCGNCSALDSHSLTDCESNAYCFHCRASHSLRSRECPRYRLEQDILHLANSSFISLGSARRELAHRQGRSGEAKSYATSVGSLLSYQPSVQGTSPSCPPPVNTQARSCAPPSSGVPVINRYSILEKDTGDTSQQEASSAILEVHPAPSLRVSQKPQQKKSKRHHNSSESVDSSEVPPTKVCVASSPTRLPSRDKTVLVPVEDSVRPDVSPANGATSMDIPEDTSLRDEDLPDNLIRQMSQESLTTESTDRSQVEPTPDEASGINSLKVNKGLSAEVPRPAPLSLKLVSSSAGNAAVPRPSSRPHQPVPSLTKIPAPTKFQRTIKLAGQVSSGKSLSGTRLQKKPK